MTNCTPGGRINKKNDVSDSTWAGIADWRRYVIFCLFLIPDLPFFKRRAYYGRTRPPIPPNIAGEQAPGANTDWGLGTRKPKRESVSDESLTQKHGQLGV